MFITKSTTVFILRLLELLDLINHRYSFRQLK